MQPVLLDVTRLFYSRLIGRRPTGVDRVSLEYVRHFGPRAHALLCRGRFLAVLPDEASRNLFAALLDDAIDFRPVFMRVLRTAAIRRRDSSEVSKAVLINTGHLGLENPNWAWPLRRRGARPVYFVHDLIPIDHPEYCRHGADRRHVSRIRNVLGTGAGIIVNSLATLASLEGFGASIGMRCPPAVVAPLAPAPLSGNGPRPMKRPYFVILGTIEPRKNHWLVLQVWRSLVARLGSAAPALVIIGRRGWENENVIDLLDRCELLRGSIFEFNHFSDTDVALYLRHAQALLMPSFAEGFGLPVVEALALGVPVIASNLTVFHEIAGEIPDYADPLAEARWEQLVLGYSNGDGCLRAAQLRRLESFRVPTWPEHFSRVDAFLENTRAP